MPAPDTDAADSPAYLSETWLDLDWSPWVPFDAPREYFYIPKSPGVYRIRATGSDPLMYIGETGQSLHKKLSELRQALRRGDLMPWSDPHAEAPALWAYWVEWLEARREQQNATGPSRHAGPEEPEQEDTGASGQAEDTETEPAESEDDGPAPVMLECSAAALDASAAGRKGMEAFLLYKYRQERGESPLCNFGRFHPRYRRSTTRKEGKRGGRLMESHQDNPAGWPGTEPLEAVGTPGDRDWMGLEWTAWQPLSEDTAKTAAGAGLYLLAGAGSQEIVYIGQAADLRERIAGHAAKPWDDRPLVFSYQVIGHAVLPHHLRELEGDLLGNYYEMMKKAPEFRFRMTGR